MTNYWLFGETFFRRATGDRAFVATPRLTFGERPAPDGWSTRQNVSGWLVASTIATITLPPRDPNDDDDENEEDKEDENEQEEEPAVIKEPDE